MKRPEGGEARQARPSPTSIRYQEKKQRGGSIKELVGQVGSAIATIATVFATTGSVAAALVSGGLNVVVGTGFKHVGAAVGAAHDARRELVEAGSAGGGGDLSIAAIKSAVAAATSTARDSAARIAGMTSEVEEILSSLRGALDGSTASQVDDAFAFVAQAVEGFESASANATGAASAANGWAASL